MPRWCSGSSGSSHSGSIIRTWSPQRPGRRRRPRCAPDGPRPWWLCCHLDGRSRAATRKLCRRAARPGAGRAERGARRRGRAPRRQTGEPAPRRHRNRSPPPAPIRLRYRRRRGRASPDACGQQPRHARLHVARAGRRCGSRTTQDLYAVGVLGRVLLSGSPPRLLPDKGGSSAVVRAAAPVQPDFGGPARVGCTGDRGAPTLGVPAGAPWAASDDPPEVFDQLGPDAVRATPTPDAFRTASPAPPESPGPPESPAPLSLRRPLCRACSCRPRCQDCQTRARTSRRSDVRRRDHPTEALGRSPGDGCCEWSPSSASSAWSRFSSQPWSSWSADPARCRADAGGGERSELPQQPDGDHSDAAE